MSHKVAKFYKVTLEQFAKDWKDTFSDNPEYCVDEVIKSIYDNIELPTRATVGSNGYDFHIPCNVVMEPGDQLKIPTGIKCNIDYGWGLFIIPRSGLGFKYKLQLFNTIGDIDCDYYHSDNEGHIFAKLFNSGTKTLKLKQGDAFMQGVFLPYGITYDDNTTKTRNGGMGSTDNSGESKKE